MSSSISIGRSENIAICNSYARDAKKPFRIVNSENISISNTITNNSSYSIYIDSCNDTVISSGFFNASRNAIEVYYSVGVKVENIIVYGVPKTYGLRLYKSENVEVKSIALFNASFHVIGYYYYFYGGYSARTGEYEYGVKFVWRPKYYNIKITNLTVNSLPVLYGYNLTDKVINDTYGQIILVNAKNIRVENQHIRGMPYGIYVFLSKSVEIVNNELEETKEGIIILGSDQVTIENNTIRNTTSYAIYVLGSKITEIRYNSFIDTNKSIYHLHAHVEIVHNYWSNQTHIDKDHDGINDCRYNKIDPDPLYQQNTKPKTIFYTYLATGITYYYLLFIMLILLLAKKQQSILNWLLG